MGLQSAEESAAQLIFWSLARSRTSEATSPAHTDLSPHFPHRRANPPLWHVRHRRDVVAGSDRAVLVGRDAAPAHGAAGRLEGAADGVAGVADGVGSDAEEA